MLYWASRHGVNSGVTKINIGLNEKFSLGVVREETGTKSFVLNATLIGIYKVNSLGIRHTQSF